MNKTQIQSFSRKSFNASHTSDSLKPQKLLALLGSVRPVKVYENFKRSKTNEALKLPLSTSIPSIMRDKTPEPA